MEFGGPTPETVPWSVAGRVLASAIVLFAAGYVLWPPGRVYWAVLPLGGRATLALVCAVAVGLGAAIGWATGLELRYLAVGGVAAYAVGMRLVEGWIRPDSPVHLIGYGLLLGSLLFGAALYRVGTG